MVFIEVYRNVGLSGAAARTGKDKEKINKKIKKKIGEGLVKTENQTDVRKSND